MSSPRDRLGRADGPALQLVRSDAAGSAEPVTTPALDAEAGTDPAATIEVARELLAAADPVAHHRMLAGLVRSSHSSVLQELPYSSSYPFHDPTVVVVEPEPSNIDTIELYAKAAYPDFDKVLASAFRDPAVDHLISALHHLVIEEGQNVAVVTNHGQIIDIALVVGALQAAWGSPHRTVGVLGEHTDLHQTVDRTNVVVSRMVATRQAFNLPALQVLQCATRTYLSVPQTHSRRRSRIDPDLARANNLVMRHELSERLAGGGQVLAMAASGSQDLLLPKLMQKARAAWRQRRGDDPGEDTTLHLQPLYDGTINLMRSCRYVLPIAISLDPGAPACVIGGLTRLRHDEDCHRVMDWIALAHQEATGVPTIYHRHEDDLLTQVRAFMHRQGQ